MRYSPHFKPNNPAPDPELQYINGMPLSLAFTRRFDCPQCTELVDELAAVAPAIREKSLGPASMDWDQIFDRLVSPK